MNWLRKWLIGEEYINFQESMLDSTIKQLCEFAEQIGHQNTIILDLSKELNDLRNQLAAQQPVESPAAAGRRRLPWSEFKPLLEAHVKRRS